MTRYKRTKVYIPEQKKPEIIGYHNAYNIYKDVKSEYAECRKVEDGLKKKYKREISNYNFPYHLSQFQFYGNAICKHLLVKLPIVVHLPGGVSHYDHLHIVLSCHSLGSSYAFFTFLHELAHHIVGKEGLSGMDRGKNTVSHGSDFLWVIEMVYSLVFGAEKIFV